MTVLNALAKQINEFFEIEEDGKVYVLDAFRVLSTEDYQEYTRLINTAIELSPTEPLFWFWKGWGHQFFEGKGHSLGLHPRFEEIENAYDRVIQLEPNNGPAHFMQAYLYWDNARRATLEPLVQQLAQAAKKSDKSGIDKDDALEIIQKYQELESNATEYYPYADFTAARELWAEVIPKEGHADQQLGSLPSTSRYIDPGPYLLYIPNNKVWFKLLSDMGDDVIDKEHLGHLYYGLAYALMDDWYPRLDVDEIRLSFEKILAINHHIGQCADARLYLGMLYTERLGKDPRFGLEYFTQILKIWNESTNKTEIDSHNAFEQFDFCLTEFLQDSPNFRGNNPETCIDLFENSIAAGLIIEPDRHNLLLFQYAGEMCNDLGRYKDGLKYLEQARNAGLTSDELDYELTISFLFNDRTDEALTRFSRIGGIGRQKRLLLALMLKTRDMQQQSAFLEQIIPYLQRQELSQNTLVRRFDELSATLLSDLEKIILGLPKGLFADEAVIEVISTKTAEQVQKVIDRNSDYYDEFADVCSSNWPEYWHRFPEELQALIISGEIMHQVWSHQKKADYALSIMQWGKVAEVAFKHSFVIPFAKHLDRKGTQSLVTWPTDSGMGTVVNGKRDWVEFLPTQNLSKLVGLLNAASRDEEIIVKPFLQEYGYMEQKWTQQVPVLMQKVRPVRNDANHTSSKFRKRDADDVRAILTTGGLLSIFGEVFAR